MKKIILVIMMMIPLFYAAAQENDTQPKQEEKAAIRTTYAASKFWDAWFISLNGGIADLMSEENRYVDFMDRVTPTVGFSVGKWLSPVWGLRLNITGSKLQGYATVGYGGKYLVGNWYLGTNHPYPGDPGAPGSYSYTNAYLGIDGTDQQQRARAEWVGAHFLNDWNGVEGQAPYTYTDRPGYFYNVTYLGGTLDFLLNVNNVFVPYNPKRFFEIILLGGIGYAHTFKEKSKIGDYTSTDPNLVDWLSESKDYYLTAVNSVGAKVGIQTKFRLSNAIDFNLEGQLFILPENFDRRVGDDKTMDGVANYMAGFTYKFKQREFKEPYCPPVVDQRVIVPPAPVVAKDDCCDELRARLQRIEELLNKKQENKQSVVIEKEHLKVVVHFLIDKHNVRPSEMYKLDEIAKFMNKYPQVRVSVSGYADKKTAYPAYNQKLSERRANEVIRILTSQYGLDKGRFTITAYGDTVQPFDVNELNRAVIAFDID